MGSGRTTVQCFGRYDSNGCIGQPWNAPPVPNCIPHFVSLFLADDYDKPNGKYFQRSPVMHASKVTTPLLNVCRARDRRTPPQEAIQFHNALLNRGAKSVLITYPEEGHGVRKWPAAIDYTTRLVTGFDEHMGADKNRRDVKGENPCLSGRHSSRE